MVFFSTKLLVRSVLCVPRVVRNITNRASLRFLSLHHSFVQKNRKWHIPLHNFRCLRTAFPFLLFHQTQSFQNGIHSNSSSIDASTSWEPYLSTTSQEETPGWSFLRDSDIQQQSNIRFHSNAPIVTVSSQWLGYGVGSSTYSSGESQAPNDVTAMYHVRRAWTKQQQPCNTTAIIRHVQSCRYPSTSTYQATTIFHFILWNGLHGTFRDHDQLDAHPMRWSKMSRSVRNRWKIMIFLKS